MEGGDRSIRHNSVLLKGTEEDVSEISKNTMDNHIAYEISQFCALEESLTLPKSFYTLIDRYLPYAKKVRIG